MYNCHFNGPVCFLMIFMQQIIIRVLFIYHGKDIDLNTDSFLQSWVSHMTMWCLNLPFGKMVECNNTNPPNRISWGYAK